MNWPTIPEAAKDVNTCTRRIVAGIYAGKIKAVKKGGVVFINPRSIKRLKEGKIHIKQEDYYAKTPWPE